MDRINSMRIALCAVLITLVQPAVAWGPITHLAITSDLSTDMKVREWTYFNGGGLGPDTFYYIGDKDGFSAAAHSGYYSADLPRDMLAKAGGDPKKVAYANGWWSHYGSDPYGHGYVSTRSGETHETVEMLVDANTADKVKSPVFDVPYGLLQAAYNDVYKKAPSKLTIYYAVKIQQAAIYIERSLIARVPESLKASYNNFWPYYDASIVSSKNAINDPQSQPGIDLYGGKTPFELLISTATIDQEKEKRAKIDKDIRDAAEELLNNGDIDVSIEDDTSNEIFKVKEPSVKNKKKFDEAIEKLARKKIRK